MNPECVDTIVRADAQGVVQVAIRVPDDWVGKSLHVYVVPDVAHTKALEAMDRLAARGGLDISNPVAWQREIRKDRPLPGRD